MKNNDFTYYLRKFLTDYLPNEKGLSVNTIDAYRYTFILLLEYLCSIGLKAEKIKIIDITRSNIEHFLTYLESKKKNSATTRNCRLAAVHSFFRYLQYEYPDYMDEYKKIIEIPFKKTKSRTMAYLTIEAMTTLLEQIDINKRNGYRDYMMILLLYETAVRVSELINITINDFRLTKPYNLKVIGKGNKQRSIPISDVFVKKLVAYIDTKGLNNTSKTTLLFSNSSKQKLTRAGINYIVNKYISTARESHSVLYPDKVTPHTLRHTKAMHLLGDDVNLIYIRDILGHSSIQTTEVYARTDSARLRNAIESAYKDISTDEKPEWENESVLKWLKKFYE